MVDIFRCKYWQCQIGCHS
ncbi:hypothetical protein YPPY61_2835, partial [Yersinia pestis PY-61]